MRPLSTFSGTVEARSSCRQTDRHGFARVAFVSGVVMAAALLVAHEGHELSVRPTYRQVQVGDAGYRVGFAMVPQDPVVGEDVRFEFRVLRGAAAPAAPSPDSPVTLENPQVEIVPTDGAAVPASRIAAGEKPGTHVVRYRFPDGGQFGVAIHARSGTDSITAEFPVLVAAGPVARAPVVVDAIILLIFGGIGFAMWRGRTREGTSFTAGDGALAAAGLVVLVGAHLWIAPRLGRWLLPDRHPSAVAWEPEAGAKPPDEIPSEPVPHTHPPGTPPHSHEPAPPRGRGGDPDSATLATVAAPGAAAVPLAEIASTVVPVPGQLVDVVVPMTSRVLFEDFVPRLGRSVRRGQTIAVLEHHYILHDANHLINERWPYLVATLASRRATFDLELKVARLRHALDTGDAAVRQMMTLTQTVPQAETELAEARLRQQQAEKALALHDAQITKGNLVRRPLTAPIDGTIDEVHFTQGQLKYENDKLLTILDLSRVWVDVRFPESAASRTPPRHLTFVSPAFPGMSFDGRLARVADTLDPRTRTVSAFFEVANPRRLLRVGMRLAAGQSGASPATAGTAGGGVLLAANAVTPPELTLQATVKPQPERTAEVTAPLWGRIEFSGPRLNVGDRVKKGQDLLNIVLELSVDERYPMEARAADINAERGMAATRLERAAQQYQQAVEALKTNPGDAFRKKETELTENRHRAAQLENLLLTRQAEAFEGVMKRRDPRITVVQAPISGVITELGFRPGELNRTGEFRRLLTIVDPSRVWLEAQVYENQSAALLHGTARASFTSPGLPSQRTLEPPIAVSGSVNPESGTLNVIFDVPNPDGALKVGASAQIVIPRN